MFNEWIETGALYRLTAARGALRRSIQYILRQRPQRTNNLNTLVNKFNMKSSSNWLLISYMVLEYVKVPIWMGWCVGDICCLGLGDKKTGYIHIRWLVRSIQKKTARARDQWIAFLKHPRALFVCEYVLTN